MVKVTVINKTCLLFAVATLISYCLAGCFPQSFASQPTIVHNVENIDIKLLWSRSEVYTIQDDFRPAMSAGYGLLCILGDIVYPPEKKISCVDGISGDAKWQKASGNAMDGLVAQDGVYITYSGGPGVEKYNYQGDLIWSRSLTGTGVIYFYLYDDEVQLFLHPERFLILNAETGEELENLKDVEIILKTATEVFVKNSTLESKDLNTDNSNWSFEIGSSIRLKPLITENSIFLKTGNTIGSVLAVNRKNGDVIWRTKREVISNIVYIPQTDRIIALTESGSLVSINVSSEEQTQLVEFSNPPFFLNGEENVGGYELAFDEDNNILFVLLGDSRQLFAFQLK